jgi:aminoglycoside phosphotransferase (APT) family kinase protein
MKTKKIMTGTEAPSSTMKQEKLFESSKKVLNYINGTHGLSFKVIERFSGGYQSGAYLLQNSEGEKAVLKWNNHKSEKKPVDEAAAAIKLARSFGWPTPDWLAWGITPSGYPYQVQEYVQGEHQDKVGTILVKDALRVIDLQAGRAPEMEKNWTKFDRDVVFNNEVCFYSKIFEYSESGKALIELLRSKAEPFRDTDIQDNDLVHGDFHNQNTFMEDDRITGLIDAETLGRGSRLHDVTTLIVFAVVFDEDREPIEPLVEYCKKHAGPGEFEITLFTNLAAFVSIFCRKGSEIGDQKVSDATKLVNDLFP